MPDYGDGQSWIQRELEQIEAPSTYGDEPAPDYGTTLLETSATSQHHHQLSGGRKVNGGIMFLTTYKGPTVNIRVPKWLDCVFWIKAPDLESAKWIADAVFYYTGRPPFHFHDRHFDYPPLVLGTGQSLNTKEKCELHVAKIAKGPALRGERGDYRERVKKLVLETLKHLETVHFLGSLRAMARPAVPPPIAIPAIEGADPLSPLSEEAEALSPLGEEADPLSPRSPLSEEVDPLSPVSEEDRAPMEVDDVSEEVVRSLAPVVHHVDAATLFLRAADTTTFESSELVDMSTAFVAGFAMDLDDNNLHSVGQSISFGHRKVKVPSNLAPLLEGLDEEEVDTYKRIELPAWEPFSSQGPRNRAALSVLECSHTNARSRAWSRKALMVPDYE